MEPALQKEKIIMCSGLRGGAGTTSLVAMLADALQRLGHSVLAIDLNPQDLLRLHFNIPYADKHGWMYGELYNHGWSSQSYQITSNLWVLPYGRHGVVGSEAANPLNLQETTTRVWQSHAQGLFAPQRLQQFDWILIDAPVDTSAYTLLQQQAALHVLVAPVDIAAHILLGQYSLGAKTKFIINKRDPSLELKEAIALDWSMRYGSAQIPISIPQDEHVPLALAHKMPATTYYPQSAAAQSIQSLALWCMYSLGAADA